MRRNLPEGTEVFIYKYNNFKLEYDIGKYIRGKVIRCELTDDLSQHGRPWCEEIYTVLGEDKKEYECTYGRMIRTPEDHIRYLESLIHSNNDEINKRTKENDEYKNMIQVAKNFIEQQKKGTDEPESAFKELWESSKRFYVDEKGKIKALTRKSNNNNQNN